MPRTVMDDLNALFPRGIPPEVLASVAPAPKFPMLAPARQSAPVAGQTPKGRAKAAPLVAAGDYRSVPAGAVLVPLPPSVNSAYRNVAGVGRVKSRKYRQWERAAVPLLRSVPTPSAYPVEVMAVIFPGRGWVVTADVANREKALTDGLVKAGVLADDSSRYVAGVRVGVSAERRADAAFVAVWLRPWNQWWTDITTAAGHAPPRGATGG